MACMGDRKWENLPVDCLVAIFARVGLESLIEGVSYVCKPWYHATLSPLCWQSLIEPTNLPCSRLLESLPARSRKKVEPTLEAFVKFVIRRSHGSVNVVVSRYHSFLPRKVLNCIGEECPRLKRLVLPSAMHFDMPLVSSLICKWKSLEALEITTKCSMLKEIITQISAHCKNFSSLRAIDPKSQASAVATLLPNIEFLSLRGSVIKRSDLVRILKGCKKLVHLDVSYCIGFDVDDEILDLASHIANFNFDGSALEYDDDADDYMSIVSYLDIFNFA